MILTILKFNLIHMNGRVYDPTIGRFLSPDPHIQAPYNTQSYNRYAYVLNNPLKYTDPSGYFFKKIRNKIKKELKRAAKKFKKHSARSASFIGIIPELKPVKKFFIKYKWAQQVGMIVAGYVGGPITAARFSAYLTRINGGSSTDILRSFAISYISAETANWIGHGNNGASPFGSNLEQALAHGATQEAFTKAGGGEFKDGFTAGFTSSMLDAVPSTGNKTADMVINITTSGATTHLAGGKFQDGARSAAFVYLFNNSFDDVDNVCGSVPPACNSDRMIQDLKTVGEIGSWTHPAAWPVRVYNNYDSIMLGYDIVTGKASPLNAIPNAFGRGTQKLYQKTGMNQNWSARSGKVGEFYLNQGIQNNDNYISP